MLSEAPAKPARTGAFARVVRQAYFPRIAEIGFAELPR